MGWIPSFKKPDSGSSGPEIVTWSEGTDEQIVAMLDAHYNGDIDIHDYWSVGDKRTVQLSAMTATDVGETHTAQNVTFILTDVGGKYLTDGVTECAFQVDQKDCLLENGYMNSSRTNTGGWKNSKRRVWCNDTYYNAIPETLRPIFKQYINQSGTGGGSSSGTESTVDYFALRAEIEVFNKITYSVTGEGSKVTYYLTSANRIKNAGDSSGSACAWFGRSPRSGAINAFCGVNINGSAAIPIANDNNFIAPFGVI